MRREDVPDASCSVLSLGRSADLMLLNGRRSDALIPTSRSNVMPGVHTIALLRKRARIGLSTRMASTAVTMSNVIPTLKTGTQLPVC